MTKCLSEDYDCGLVSALTLSSGFRDLNDGYGVELKSYDEGMIWAAIIAGAHVTGQASGESSVTVRLPDETTPLASASRFKCEYSRTIVNCDQGVNSKKCYENEYVSANRQWLKTINLVQNHGEGADPVLDPCLYTFESKSQGWVTENNAANNDTAENAARALCENRAPDEDIDATVVLRSCKDSFVVA